MKLNLYELNMKKNKTNFLPEEEEKDTAELLFLEQNLDDQIKEIQDLEKKVTNINLKNTYVKLKLGKETESISLFLQSFINIANKISTISHFFNVRTIFPSFKFVFCFLLLIERNSEANKKNWVSYYEFKYRRMLI